VEWQLFDADSERYEAWYASQRGQRVDQAERELLGWLLDKVPSHRSIFEVGCGTGHFTAWLAGQGDFVIGLDRAPAMLTTLKHVRPSLPAVLGDAHALPFRNRAVDVTAFISTLEFLEQPETALVEAVRVSRSGLIVVVLNKWSLGGLSRRWGPQAKGRILGSARDYNLPQLIRLLRAAAAGRVAELWWTSALHPFGRAELLARSPFGDVIGVAMVLRP